MKKSDFISKIEYVQFICDQCYRNFYIKENIAYRDGFMYLFYKFRIGRVPFLSIIINSYKKDLDPIIIHRYSFDTLYLIFHTKKLFIKNEKIRS